MDFGDDPLGDVLSDGSNDSFFDEPKSSAKRASLTKTPEKKSVTDIFNISDKPTESAASKRSDDWLGLDSKDAKSSSRTQKLTKKISFEDDDILNNLGLTKRPSSRSEIKAEKKIDLFESILGPSKSEDFTKKASLDDILKESKTRSSESISTRPSTSTVKDSLPFSEAPREGRRSKVSTGLLDPLGLFGNEPKQEDKPVSAPPASKAIYSASAPNIPTQSLPDWLGEGSSIKHSKSDNVLKKTVEQPIPSNPPEEDQSQKSLEKITISNQNDESQASFNSIMAQQKLAQSQVEYQNTAIALQQQESQLLMALQMKKYEDNLSEIQSKQHGVLKKQEHQFNMLLERQLAKQQIIENNMRLQQERINAHIQLLLTGTKHAGLEEVDEFARTASEEKVKVDQNIITSLKQRQHEEIFLLEESYKKQVNLLEESLESVEKRLKNDVEKMSENFEEKIKNVEQQHEQELTKYKRKIQDLETQHSEEIQQIRDNNSKLIEEIKHEYSILLENIKEAKKTETSIFHESGSYIQKLDSNMEILYETSKNLGEIRSHIEKDYGIFSRAREESLKAKEHEISLMKSTLEKCREAAETERSELLSLVRTLETKIAEQNQNAREERWALQQAASTLAARSAAMDREMEFNRTAIERERDQLKTLKESILAEQEKMALQLTEEKLSLSAERSRLDISSKLATNYDAQKAKTEIEAALQIAKEATEMTDKERESLHREKCEVEKLKRTLRDQEKRLSLKENELEDLMREAQEKQNEGGRAMLEARTIESKYNDRLRDLQSQLVNLSHRERKLAEEKIALSKERLALNTMMRQNKKCSLCSADPQKLDDNTFNLDVINMRSYFSQENIDSNLTRLRLEPTDESFLNIEENVSM